MLDVGNSQEVAKGILESRFAFGFVEGPVQDEALEVREFRRDRIIAVVAAGHPLVKSKPLSVRELADAPSLLREPGSGTREIVERAFSRQRLQPRCSLCVANSEALKRAALEGGGIAWISDLCVTEELRTGRLVELKTPRLSLERPLYTLRLRDRHSSPSALRFMEEFDVFARQSPGSAAPRR
jgi:DNA-binding transcriptional LysR family regulator